ncbi:amidase domain-containing protein [Microbacterium sp. B2969]|uniref:Amidase domain-containing protein n=1 Tax=Microbacterium alkaliflavum TaxID=3248839 RepID=A0ABW7QEC0_9MICO
MTLSPRERAARRRMFRRRRAVVLLVLVLIVVTAAVVAPRIAASAAAADARATLADLAGVAGDALADSSTLVSSEASSALTVARDAAMTADPTDEEAAGATHAMAAAVTAFKKAAVSDAQNVLGTWSDAEKSVEDELSTRISTLRKATPEKLAAALAATATAADAVRASAQEYRDGIIAAAKGSSSQPTGGSVDAQLDYLLAHATDYNTAQWGDYNPAGGDCVNFASQGLLARGWVMDESWRSGGPWKASKAWRSTPDIDAYLAAQGFAYSTIDDLDRVRVGDIGVFNWGDTGPGLDHTMTVSRVEYSPDGPVISFASHNTDGQYRPMPATLTAQGSGSTVRIYSIP